MMQFGGNRLRLKDNFQVAVTKRVEAKLLEKLKAAKQKPENEHDRLVKVLGDLAVLGGFVEDLSQALESLRPDLVRLNQWGGLLVGEAKDANNETIHNKETLERIDLYLKGLVGYVKQYGKGSGSFILATNSEWAAKDWAMALPFLCFSAGFLSSHGHIPSFAYQKMNATTFIVRQF